MAIVVFNNGNGTGVWSDPLNWVGGSLPTDADTADLDANCILDMNDIVAVPDIGANTLTMNATTTLTGMTGHLIGTGTIAMAAGTSLLWNSASWMNVTTAKFLATGTQASQITIDNVGAAGLEFRPIDGSYFKWCNIAGKHNQGDTAGHVIYEDCALDGENQSGTEWQPTTYRRCFLYNYGANHRFILGPFGAENCVFGYKRDGTAAVLNRVRIDCISGYASGYHIQNCVVNATNGIQPTQPLLIDNYGYVVSSMLPGTGSALDLAVVAPGIGKCIYAVNSLTANFNVGDAERSTLAKKSGDYGTRFTPGSACSTTKPKDSSFYIPITSGQNLSVSVWARRSGMTSDCAKMLLDPEGAVFTPAVSTELLTNVDTWYELTVSGVAASGTTDVRVVFRVDEYENGNVVDFADLTYSIT